MSEPTPEDLADTLSASYRTMRDLHDSMDNVLGAVLFIEILLSVFLAASAFYLMRKALS